MRPAARHLRWQGSYKGWPQPTRLNSPSNCNNKPSHCTPAKAAYAATGCACRTFLVTLRIVTNSSADEGWMPTTVSSCAFVTPILTATAKPCRGTINSRAHTAFNQSAHGVEYCSAANSSP